MKDILKPSWQWVVLIIAALTGALGLYACSALQGVKPAADTASDAVHEACQFAILCLVAIAIVFGLWLLSDVPAIFKSREAKSECWLKVEGIEDGLFPEERVVYFNTLHGKASVFVATVATENVNEAFGAVRVTVLDRRGDRAHIQLMPGVTAIVSTAKLLAHEFLA